MALFRSALILSVVAVSTIQQGGGCGGDDDTPTPIPSDELVDCTDTSRTFWAWDFSDMPPRSVELAATCVWTGPTSYLYVAEDQWGTTVTPEMALEFMNTWEYQSSPDALNPAEGIFENDRLVFGDIPDALDDDPRMYVLLMDMKDYVSDDGTVYSFDGYFNAYDELPDQLVQAQTFGLYHSNEVEMLYLNSRIRPVTDPYTLGVAAHELQHLIAYNYDTSEEVWMSESLAEVAMLVNGYFTDTAWVADYASDPSYPLVTSFSGNYGSFLLWGMYLFEQEGREFMTVIQDEQTDGIDGLNAALNTYGSSRDFQALFIDWFTANAIQDPAALDGRFGYDFSSDLPEMARVATLTASAGTYAGALEAFGVDYIEIPALETGLGLNIATRTPDAIRGRLIEFSDAGIVLTDVVPDASGNWSLSLSADPNTVRILAISNVSERQIDSGETSDYTVTLR